MPDKFVERAAPPGRPEIPADAMLALSLRARTEHGWRTDSAISPLDRGLVVILSHFPIGQWVPVQAIINRVDEYPVEVLGSVSRMFSIGLVDVEGLTTRNPSGVSVVGRTDRTNTGP